MLDHTKGKTSADFASRSIHLPAGIVGFVLMVVLIVSTIGEVGRVKNVETYFYLI